MAPRGSPFDCRLASIPAITDTSSPKESFHVTPDARALDTRFHVACALAREAGEVAKRRFLDRGSFTVGFKGPQDFLTEVDGEVERLIATKLRALFPEDGFIGEEGEGRVGHEGAPIWVVDPIDGTANFARGAPHFCISIAALVGREIEIGVIYDPMVDELFAARRGAGATVNGAKMNVSDARDLKSAAIEVGWNARDGAEQYLAVIGRIVAAGSAVGRSGSGALGLAYVAAGRRDGYVETFMNSWDCLAAIALIRESGGYVSDFLANDGMRNGNSILACPPALKDELIRTAEIEGLVL
jgi:myo-inositol-1(or 4)-monophosphatase